MTEPNATATESTIEPTIEPITESPTEPIAVSPESTPLESAKAEPQPSYVKLAMRNMVRKGGKSLFHFGLTTLGLLGLLVGLAYLTR